MPERPTGLCIVNDCPVLLTSVSHPTDQLAHAVIEMLMEHIEGFEGAPHTVILPE